MPGNSGSRGDRGQKGEQGKNNNVLPGFMSHGTIVK